MRKSFVIFLPLLILVCGCTALGDSTISEQFANLLALNTVTLPVLRTAESSVTPPPPILKNTPSPHFIRPTAKLWATNSPLSTPTALFADVSAYPASKSASIMILEDITIPDGTQLLPNEMFVKSWRVQNSGSTIWNDRYKLVIAYDNPFLSPQVVNAIFLNASGWIDFSIGTWEARTYNVLPGSTADLAIPLQAPAQPGDYRVDCFLINDMNELLPQRFWLQFSVGTPAIHSSAENIEQAPQISRKTDWSGVWVIRDPFQESAMEQQSAWLTQTENQVSGFFHDRKGEPVLIEGSIQQNGRELTGVFSYPWQNRATAFTWRLSADNRQFYSVTSNGKIGFGSICGGRDGAGFPDYCSLPKGD